MVNPPSPVPAPDADKPSFRGRLTYSLIPALVLLTFIPLLLMAVTFYLRTRSLLQSQAATELQSLVDFQSEQVVHDIQIREIRLDRIMRRGSFINSLNSTLNLNRSNADFPAAREMMIQEFQAINKQEGGQLFNEFFVLNQDDIIQIASRPEWEGLNLADSPYINLLKTSDARSFAFYDFAPLYTKQYITLTIKKYKGYLSLTTMVGISESKSAQSILESLMALSPSSSAYFVTRDLAFIGIDPYKRELAAFEPSQEQKRQVAGMFEPMTVIPQDQAGILYFNDTAGNPVIAKSKWISNLYAGIVLEVPQDIIFGQLNILIPFTIILLIITLVITGLVITVGTNRFVRPLLKLAETTRRFAAGEWHERFSIKRKDELGLLAYSFNQMADELSTLYQSLESRVEKRTSQIRTAADVAQGIVTAINIDELLRKTVNLIVERFGYYHAGIFLIDRAGRYAVLQAAYGPAAEKMLTRGHKLEVGSQSIIGWVSANNLPRVASDVTEDSIHFINELLPGTRAEVGVPISSGNHVLGVLDVQSAEHAVFDPETIAVLQTLANQIAAAIQNVTLAESTQVNLTELERIYRGSREITLAQTEHDVFETASRILKDSPYVSAIFLAKENALELFSFADPDQQQEETTLFSNKKVEVNPEEVIHQLTGGFVIVDPTKSSRLTYELIKIPRNLRCKTAAFIPVIRGEMLLAIIMLGARRKQQLTAPLVQPYAQMVELITTALEKVAASNLTEHRMTELEALANISQTVAMASDLPSFYAALHEQVRRTIGEFSFVLALYIPETDSISIPYMYEEGQTSSLDPFPLGEGLTSLLIRTHQPLMIVEDTEKRISALGVKIVGKPAKSWLGAPLLVRNEAIGAIILQDLSNENSFDEDDLHFLTALAGQVAGAIYNIRLLDESRQRTIQLQAASEIARDLSMSLDLDELLQKSTSLIRERFDFYHAAVFMIEASGEYAIIREATGEAGIQMKRAGHKLGVGSKSIVGYVSGRGEPLVINDTSKDATYYANPLLPKTLSEAAIPLKIGERILGVLDVQSTHPYAFGEDNMRTLQILADQLAIAVINSELFAETQEHLSEHRLLHHITTSAASGTTLEEALESAVQGLQVSLGGDRVAILLVDKDRNVLEFKATVGYSEENISQIHVALGSGITGWVAAHRKLLRVGNVTEEPRYIQISPNTRSELAIPLIYRNEILGVLNVESEQLDAYDQHDEEMLGTLAGSLAAIIANARLLEQVRQQVERERRLYEVTTKIRRSTDIHTILATTANELNKTFGARRTQIKIDIGNKGDGPEKNKPS